MCTWVPHSSTIIPAKNVGILLESHSVINNYWVHHHVIWKYLPGWRHSGLQSSIWASQIPKTEVISGKHGCTPQASSKTELRDNIISYSEPLWRCNIALGFSYNITHLFILLPSATVFPSLYGYLNFFTLGRDIRFGHCAGLESWQQYYSNKCLSLSPFLFR